MQTSSPFSSSHTRPSLADTQFRGWRQVLLVLGTVAAGPFAMLTTRFVPALSFTYRSAIGHFLIVTIAASLAVTLALLLLRVALVRRDGRVLMISAAFSALSATFLTHAVSTPGVLFEHTRHATMWSTPIALCTGALLFACSTQQTLVRQPALLKHWRVVFSAGVVMWLLYSAWMLVYVPSQLARVEQTYSALTAAPQNANQAAQHNQSEHNASEAVQAAYDAALQATTANKLIALAPHVFPLLYGLSGLLYLYVAALYGLRWRRNQTLPLAAMSCGAILLAETALAASIGTHGEPSFWLYHILLVAAVLITSYGIVVGYEQSGSLSSIVEGLLLDTTLERQRVAFQSGMITLLEALERGNVQSLPALRAELRGRFALAEDQIDLLEHTVKVVAQEREEQRRLRALAEVSQAATIELDPDQLLANATASFARSSEARLCAVGLVEDEMVVFNPVGCYVSNQTLASPVIVPLDTWRQGLLTNEEPYVDWLQQQLDLPFESHPAVVVPLRHRRQLLGVLIVQFSTETVLSGHLLTICGSFGAQMGGALVNAQLHQTLQRKHEHLLRSEQAREQLTQMVAHDLKNPLTVIRGYLTLLQMGSLSNEQQDLVAGADRGSRVLLQLVSDMLDVARLEEGRLELKRSLVEPRVLLQSCVDDLRPWIEQDQKVVIVDVPVDAEPLNIDEGLMRRVISNLVSNALKHTPKNTTIRLRLTTMSNNIALQVIDKGPGIPADQLPHLFTRFGTVGPEGTHQSNTGLGLAFCRLAVDAHGGSIFVDSTPGSGSTFTVLLPMEEVTEGLLSAEVQSA